MFENKKLTWSVNGVAEAASMKAMWQRQRKAMWRRQ